MGSLEVRFREYVERVGVRPLHDPLQCFFIAINLVFIRHRCGQNVFVG